ncbi:MAG: hypothetical protein WC280_00705 [Patescibacteria group bacterium]
MNKNKKVEGIEIIEPSDINSQTIEPLDNSQSVKITSEGVDVKKSGNFVIGSLNVVMGQNRKKRQNYYQENLWHLIADIILLVIIISLVFFLIFSLNINRNKNVSLQIESDQQSITVGQLKTFELDYKVNKDIKDSEVNIVLPRGFILESTSPAGAFNQEKNSFYLGDLNSGLSSKIKINGYVVGEKDDTQMISFTFNCDKCGKNGILNSFFYSINKDIVDFEINLPERIYSGSEFEASMKLNNNASRSISNLIIDLGGDLKIEKSGQKIENNKIIIDSMAEKESLDISFFATTQKSEVELKPNLEFTFLEKKYTSQKQQKVITSKEAQFNFEAISEPTIYQDGELLSYKINYQNKGQETIKNIKIKLTSANENFSIDSIKESSESKNYFLENNIIKIEDLINNENGSINIDISYNQKNIIGNQEVSLRADIEYQINGQTIKYTKYSNKNKVSSKTSTSMSAYYYSPQGDQLGVGPLPPAVDMATNYWIFLEFNNSGNSLENLVLTAELPENVYFSGNKRVLDGRLNYAEIGKRLIWEVSEINNGINKYRANIEVTLIPESSDFNKVLNLVENIKFSFKDSFTGEDVSGNLSNITTNLENDRLSSGKGVVTIIK